MNLSLKNFSFPLLFTLSLILSPFSSAETSNRVSFGGGVIFLSKTSQYQIEVGAEYEHRLNTFLGLGGQANYLFSSPGIGLLGAPEVFVHPIATDWFLSAAPLFQIGTGAGLSAGARLGTRIPITLGIFSLIPTATVDFIGGAHNVILGLGVQI